MMVLHAGEDRPRCAIAGQGLQNAGNFIAEMRDSNHIGSAGFQPD